MDWFRPFGTTEFVLLGLFFAFYAGYLFRVIYTAKKLNTGYRGVFNKIGIRTIYFLLLMIAFMGPSFGESKREIQSVGKDILLAVDLSQSMNATDVPPSRLEKIKFELKNIVSAFSSDRIGLVIFSSEAFVQCPLTYDQNALNLFIETLHTGLVPRTGTDFAPALRIAMQKLEDEDAPSTQQKSKIIILISDGEDFGDETSEVEQQIEDSGIKLFALGVGTENGSKIRTPVGFKKDKQGNDVITRLDPSGLKALTAKTNGKYFEINDGNNDVQRLISSINQIEGELRETRQIDVSANKYFYFLLAALCLIVLDTMLSFKTIRI